jgi:hypothetical protein
MYTSGQIVAEFVQSSVDGEISRLRSGMITISMGRRLQ